MYDYKAKVLRVLDGDTVELLIDLGFTVFWKSTCRLYGLNTPELKSKDPQEKDKALKAKLFLVDKVQDKDIEIRSRELDKYGRPLIDIFYKDEYKDIMLHLNPEIIANGYAVEYFGGKK